MKKKDFVSLVFGIIGGLLFSIGMCMCLIPEWNTFDIGCVFGGIGAVILIALFFIRRYMSEKPPVKINWRMIKNISFGIFALLIFGAGMSMVLAFEGLIIQGIVVGIIGIILLMCLIPMTIGLK